MIESELEMVMFNENPQTRRISSSCGNIAVLNEEILGINLSMYYCLTLFRICLGIVLL